MISYILNLIISFKTKFYNREFSKIVGGIRNKNELSMSNDEATQLYLIVKYTNNIVGDIAEVGVYKGASAKIICMAKKLKKLYLFDTFKGLPKISKYDEKEKYFEAQYISDYKEVKKYLSIYKNVYIYKGIFPQTAKAIKNNTFSFVHLDVDIYKSTLDSLKFFYSKMNKGGIIMSHNYGNSRGVRKAFNDFFKTRSVSITKLPGSYCFVIKK
jgi:hypothetical protein